MLLTGALVAGAAYGGALAVMFAAQGRLMYPGSEPCAPPSITGLANIEEVRIETEDGLSLLAWWMPPALGRSVVVYWHGNAGPLHCRVHKFAAFAAEGYGMLMLAYRGYSGNEGRPNQPLMVKDAVCAVNWLSRHSDAPIIYYGESLGGALAMQVALHIRPQAIVLEGVFDSAANVAQKRYPMFPAARLIRDRWDTLAIAGACPSPVMMLHGGQDKVVPIRHSQRLFHELPQPKHYIQLEEAGHVDLFDHGVGAHVMEWLAGRGL